MAVDKTEKDSEISSKPQKMSSPMFPEMSESTTSSRRWGKKPRKIWKRPIRVSRLPSFGFAGSDFTFDQIPAIFSGYAAGSEDSSSSELSDASGSDSQSISSVDDENAEISHARSTRAVRKRASLKRMKSISRIPSMKFRRQLTRKLSGGRTQTRQKLKKVRSVKLRNYGDRSVLSGETIGLASQPRYLNPTSSSASKNVGKIQKNLKPNMGATAKKFSGGLTRTRSLRYSGLRRATCSSAMKDSKIGNDVSDGKVCNYMYCSLHGHHHHHGHADDANVSSLKRFVSMRRRLLKKQRSTNRRLVLLKRSLSRKRGSVTGTGRIVTVGDSADQESTHVDPTADGESSREIYQERVSSSEIYGNDDVESVRQPAETRDLSSGDVGENQDRCSGSTIRTELPKPVLSARKRWENLNTTEEEDSADQEPTHVNVTADGESNQEIYEEHVSTSEIYGNDDVESVPQPAETHDQDGCSGLAIGTDLLKPVLSARKRWGNLSEAEEEESESQPERNTQKNVKLWRLIYQQMVTGLREETSEGSEKFCGESSRSCQDGSGAMADEDGRKDVQAIDHDKSDAVKIVKQALDEILPEITDYSSDDKSVSGDKTSEHEHVKREDDQGLDLSRFASTSSLTGEETGRRGSKNWRYLKNAFLLKRFLELLEKVRDFDQREARNLSVKCDREEDETMRLRRVSKNAEEWMLDYALRQAISMLDPSQKRKVELLVQAFETVIPIDRFRARVSGFTASHMGKNIKAQMEKASSENNSGENKDEATEIQAVFGGPKSDETAELDGSSSSKEDERIEHGETETKAEKQNLIKWRNLIYKHMATSLTVNDERKHHVCENELVEDFEQSGSVDGSKSSECSSGTDQIPGRAVKLVQQALEKIVSEIPDQPSDEDAISSSSNSGKQDSTGQDTGNGWNNLKRVILLKRFVKSLEKVRKLNPRRVRCLPEESNFEAENVNLRHRSSEDRNDAENLMLDHALRQAISRLAPFQIRKVALLVNAFDTVLDGGGKSTPFRDDQACQDSATMVNPENPDHGSSPMESKTDTTSRNNGESGGGGMNGQKPNPKKDHDFNADEQRTTAGFSRIRVNQRDWKEQVEEKDTKLWKLIYKHMVTDLQTTKDGTDRAYGVKISDRKDGYYGAEPMAAAEDRCRDEDGLKIDDRSSGVVRFVREALEKVLSEIPDQSSDEQSMNSDVTTDQELFERGSELGEELGPSASMAAITTQVMGPEARHKSSEKTSRGWSSLKKAILLRRFVTELGTLTKHSNRTPRTLPLESDPEAEKINLRHRPLEGKKSSEEWMLDYALRQAISTLAPSQKRKVALLAQAFDTISLQDTISFSSPSSRRSSNSGGSPEARTPISNPVSGQEKSGYGFGKEEVADSTFRDTNEEGTRVFHRNETDDTCKMSSEKPRDSQEEGELAGETANVQQCTSLWRLLCKHMESGVAENERNQPSLGATIKEEENKGGSDSDDQNAGGESMELYQSEAVKLLEEVIDEISLPDSEGDHTGSTISDRKHLEETDTEKEASQKAETEQMPQVRKGWSNLKRVILLKRFVKALEKVRKFDPREPRFLLLNPDPEAKKINLRHQETRDKRNGEEWMVDYALQGVVSQLTPARKRKVQLLVQAFETVSVTGN
ncbi:PREDICTED: uncharacterized protein LOC104823216 [Tarenaya hassleriana]|uniref:uncharacterized protein LOC104823216 n=1 Tax=Tarenaya hassleriana TaxID=28532 RepID=UPI00053C52F8|nr:PREDICTED: uncharacterized protein LOC104823216 [Tarenaya hassleriana]